MIIAAAILKNGIVYKGEKFKDRHDNVFINNGLENILGGVIMGFVDDKDVFYDRCQAAQHAVECGQMDKMKTLCLISEDLW